MSRSKASESAVLAQIQCGALRAALASVAGAVERRVTVPILSHVLLSGDGAQLTVAGTDLDLWIERRVPIEQGQPFALAVPATVLTALVGKFPTDALISLQMHDAQLRVGSGRMRADLSTLPAEDFPAAPLCDEVAPSFTMAGDVLAAMLAHCEPAISTEEMRYYLNGIHFERAEAQLLAVSTDGHRMAVARTPAPDGSEGLAERVPPVPRKAVKLIAAMAAAGAVEITTFASRWVVRCGETQLTTKLIDGTFPDWRRVLPAPGTLFSIDRAAIKAALERVMAICSDKTRAVRFDLESDRLRISAQSAENGSAEEEVACTWPDQRRLTIGFNGGYLLGILSHLSEAGDTVHASFLTAPDPTRWWAGDAGADDEPAAQYVLMPLRV